MTGHTEIEQNSGQKTQKNVVLHGPGSKGYLLTGKGWRIF